MIHSVHFWPDGSVAAYDESGKQVACHTDDQGYRHTDIGQIIEDSDERTRFIRWRWISYTEGLTGRYETGRSDFMRWCEYHHRKAVAA